MIKRLGDISRNSMYQSITTIKLDYIKCDLIIILVMFKVYSDYQWLSIFQSRIRDCLKHSSSQNVLCGSYIAKFTPNLFWLIYSTRTKNVNVTIFKINIKAHYFLLLSTYNSQHIILTLRQKKLFGNRCRSNDLPKINRKCAEN